jgi:hypothetical protein
MEHSCVWLSVKAVQTEPTSSAQQTREQSKNYVDADDSYHSPDDDSDNGDDERRKKLGQVGKQQLNHRP